MKQILTVAFLTSYTLGLHAAQDKDKVLLAITSAHTRAFSKDNLIVSRISANNDLAPWDEAINAVKQFIDDNDPKLNPDFDKIYEINTQLINVLKIAFNSYIAPVLKNKKDRSEGLSRLDSSKLDLAALNIWGLDSVVQGLKTSKEDLIQLQDKLTTTLKKYRKSRLTNKAKGDAVEVLSRLALTLETTITKAINDSKKIEDAAAKK